MFSEYLSSIGSTCCRVQDIDSLDAVYRRRKPESTTLYQVLAEHVATFLARVEGRGTVNLFLPWLAERNTCSHPLSGAILPRDEKPARLLLLV